MQTQLKFYFEEAISIKRPAYSQTVNQYMARLALRHRATEIDAAGNLHFDRGGQTLFVAHSDTVHRDPGPNAWTRTENLYQAQGSPLGADDGAGLALLQVMMDAKIPGYYIITTNEEGGGTGAQFIADYPPRHFPASVAFDRAGVDEVIYVQGGYQTADLAYAEAVAQALTTENLWYSPSDLGVYTDNAEWPHLIPNCINVSVGYYNQHTEYEIQDFRHLERLCTQVLTIDWETLAQTPAQTLS